jgi:hypothetical protein
MKLWRDTERKTRRGGIRNKHFGKEGGIRNLSTELKEK